MKQFILILFSFFLYANSFSNETYNIRLYGKLFKGQVLDKRSLIMPLTVTHDRNSISIYSDVTMPNLQIIIKNEYENIIHSEFTNVHANNVISVPLNYMESGKYKIELLLENCIFYGYFFID